MGTAEVIKSAHGEAHRPLLFEKWSDDPEELERQKALVLGKFRPRTPPKKRSTAKQLPPPWERPISPPKTWEEAFERTIPGRPLCADDFELGVYPCRREYALDFRYIQYNRPTLFRWLIVDIDRAGAADAWREAGLPPPNLIMENPANGHAHLAWLLVIPVSGSNRISKAFRFLAAIERGFTRRLRADRAFNLHGLVKNALHEDWHVSRPIDGAYPLAKLAAALGKIDMKLSVKGERESGLGRNCALFDWLRKLAYQEVVRLKQASADFTDFMRSLLVAAMDRNRTEFHSPLSSGEVAGIVKSVAKWTWRTFSIEVFHEIQKLRGFRRAAKRWARHTTAAERASALGISRRTLYRRSSPSCPPSPLIPDMAIVPRLHLPDVEASTQLKDAQKPWEAAGISRRTWFYRQAKLKAEGAR